VIRELQAAIMMRVLQRALAKLTTLIALAAPTCASAQAQQPSNNQQPCYEVLMTVGEYGPLGSLRINKCTGETWELLAAPTDNSGMSGNRWYPLTVETREKLLKR
jgi:hypothetical protein